MGKRIKNPIETKIVEDDGEVTVSIHYGVDCEYGDLGRKGITPELTPAEQATIEQVAAASKGKAEAAEGVE